MNRTDLAIPVNLIEDLHEKTMDLLSRWGISFGDECSLELFRKHGAEVDGSQVKIPAKLVEEALKTAPTSFRLTGRNPERSFGVGEGYPQAYGPGAGMTSVISCNGERRDATVQDMEAFHKLAYTSKYCSVSAAGLLYPPGLPEKTALHTQLLTALRLSDKPLFGLTQNEDYSADSIAMARIAAGSARSGDCVCMGVVNSLSPLGWDSNMLGSMRVFAMERQPMIVAACAMSGATAHVSLAGTLVSTNAELLAGVIYMQLLSPGTPVVYGNTSGISDMGNMSLAIGAPETTMMANAIAAIAEYYHLPCRTGGSLCDSNLLDMQAGIESAVNLTNTMLCGADFVLQSLGVMQSFLSISPEKWLIDEEILDRAHRIRQGIVPPSVGLVDEIMEAMESDDGFLGHESTFEGFRNEFLSLPLSVRSEAEKEGIIAAAAKLRAKRFAHYACPQLPGDIDTELQRFITI